MDLDGEQLDRAAGTLLASAVGDALGVHYEPSGVAPQGEPEMLGGGYGDYAPGEWSDDTQMACVIAQVAASCRSLLDPAALDQIAHGFLAWKAGGATDIGAHTRHVLLNTDPGPGAATTMATVAAARHAETGHTAGNGSLMRTGPVALACLGRPREDIFDAARTISALTHADPVAGDACALWCIAVEHAVRTGELDITLGLPYVDAMWSDLLDDDPDEPSSYLNNGWVVAALQAAWAAVRRTDNLHDCLVAAVHAGGDMDTVAAIAGQLAGAVYGASAVPVPWATAVHGWPGLRGPDLVDLAHTIARRA